MNVNIDLKGGLRAMSLLKRNPGPLEPGELNQAVKHGLAEDFHCLCELADSGVLGESLVREIEQIIEDKMSTSERYGNMLPSLMITSVSGPMMSNEYEVMGLESETGNPKKKLKAESMRRATIPNLL